MYIPPVKSAGQPQSLTVSLKVIHLININTTDTICYYLSCIIIIKITTSYSAYLKQVTFFFWGTHFSFVPLLRL